MSLSRSAQAAENPDSPSSSPTPPLPTTANSRLFAPIPSSSLPQDPENLKAPSQPPAEDGASWSSSVPGSQYGDVPAEPSGTPSTGKDVKLSKASLRAAIATGFRSGCRLLASFLATREERQYEVFVPDEEDVQDVARPASNIVYRRLPDEAKGGDVIDVLMLSLALVGYVAKTLQQRAELRTALALHAAQGMDPTGEAGPTS